MKDYLYIKFGAIIGMLLLVASLIWSDIKIAEELSSLILFLTFLAILWYSKETQDLKEISIKRPFLSFNRNETIVLKNYGEGVARDIEIKINNETVHKIPLVSSIYSKHSGLLSFSERENRILEEHKDEIRIHYYDMSRKIKYITVTQWDDSLNNRDGCRIINYKWKVK